MDWGLALAIGIVIGAVVNTIGTYRYNIKQADEIERLREALKKIMDPDNFENIFEIAETALKGD